MDDDRRLQRITAPDYLADLSAASPTQIRAMRDECRAEERRLSFIRRVLQGHLDLALAEVARRSGDEQTPLVTRVTHALTGSTGAARSARAVGLYAPADAADAGIDAETARLPDVDDAELAALVERLSERERALSDQRTVLLANLDRLQDELVARYRADRTAIEEATGTLGHL